MPPEPLEETDRGIGALRNDTSGDAEVEEGATTRCRRRPSLSRCHRAGHRPCQPPAVAPGSCCRARTPRGPINEREEGRMPSL